MGLLVRLHYRYRSAEGRVTASALFLRDLWCDVPILKPALHPKDAYTTPESRSGAVLPNMCRVSNFASAWQRVLSLVGLLDARRHSGFAVFSASRRPSPAAGARRSWVQD